MTATRLATAQDASRANRRLGQGLVAASALAWSTAGYFTRLIPLDAWTILFWRGLFGGLTALIFVVLVERGGTLRAFARMGRAGLLFGFVTAASMASFLGALKLTTVAHVAIIYATVPLLAAGLGFITLRESVSVPTLIASLVALLGILLTVGTGLGEGSLSGDALALLMTVLMAAMMVIARGTAARLPMVPAACLSAFLSSLIGLPFATPLSAGPIALAQLALFGVTNMGLGLILFAVGARRVPAAETALIGVLDTPLAPLWVWLAFGETPKATTLLGGGLVLAAVIGHVLYDSRAQPKP